MERRAPGSGSRLQHWLDGLCTDYHDRIVGIDTATAETWGRMTAERLRPVIDGLIAATALVHDMTLVTRDTRDFRDTGARILSPWEE